MSAVKKLIETAVKWTGYLEKKNNKDLDDFTANAGSNNYTCFARDYQKHTGQSLQAQPWCAMYVSEMFVQAFGLDMACKLLGGSLYHYCPTGVNQFKKVGKWGLQPEPGAVIFFTNGSRAYHTGIVTEVSATSVKTIEGNTSGASGVVENGGGVCQKSYDKRDNRILGYGRPDWSLAENSEPGWIHDEHGWWYRDPDGGYPRMVWRLINHHWYCFGASGYMLTGWIQWDSDTQQTGSGDWYYLEETGDFQGACWHERDDMGEPKGALVRWYVA